MKIILRILSPGLVAVSLQLFGAASPVADEKGPAARETQPSQSQSPVENAARADANSDEQAFKELAHSIMADNKGVVASAKPLSEEERKWNEDVARVSLKNADLARQFLANFPGSRHATDVAGVEQQMLFKAAHAGSSDARSRLEELVAEKLKKPDLGDEERFKLRFVQLQAAESANEKSAEERRAAFDRDARQLLQEFPKRPEPYLMLLQAAGGLDAAKRKPAIEELLGMPGAPDAVKQRANGMLRQMTLVGHPLEIQFTAVDGREVDLAKYKGKVVLLDFWATWCSPCVAEIPHVKEAYEKFHSQGFEVVGISFDADKSSLEKFVASKDMPWPQYFDGKRWDNKFGQQYGIDSIPRMWLLDRDGNLADMDARGALSEKIEQLLAAKQTPVSAK